MSDMSDMSDPKHLPTLTSATKVFDNDDLRHLIFEFNTVSVILEMLAKHKVRFAGVVHVIHKQGIDFNKYKDFPGIECYLFFHYLF